MKPLSTWHRQLITTLVELVLEAVGTSLLLLGVTLLDELHNGLLRLHDIAEVITAVLFLPLAVLFGFIITGYVITTAIAGTTLRHRGKWTYPLTTAALYLAHSTLLFVGAGNRLISPVTNPIQLLGAALAFLCAHAGNRLLLADQPEECDRID